jgi:hypothetical protein
MSEKVTFRVTKSQKNQIERLASISKKTVSDYMRDVSLSQTLDTAKMEFYQNINGNFLEIKKNQFILTRLLILLGGEVLKSDDEIIKFYKEMALEAEKEFSN